MKKNNNKGVSMITVIITIIVIIILATISLVGNEDAINKSAQAKKEAEIAQETQLLKIALKSAENIFTGEVEKEELEEGLEEHSAVIDESYVSEDPEKKEYKVVFNKTGNSYIINKYGDITVLDKAYADNTTPNTPSTPSTPSTPDTPSTPSTPSTPTAGNTVTIVGKNVSLVGDIATMEFPKQNEWYTYGLNINIGDVVAYNGKYYIAREGVYIPNSDRTSAIAAGKLVMINIDKGVTTPSPSSVAGDIKLVGEDPYVYTPHNPDPNGWQDSYVGWWTKINTNSTHKWS